MRRAVPTFLAGALLHAAPVAGVGFDDPAWLHQRLERLLQEALGREVAIGSVRLDLGTTTTVVVEQLVVGGPDWADEPFLSVPHVEAAIDLASLLDGGTVAIERLIVREPVLALRRDEQQRSTWAFGDAGGDLPVPIDAPAIPSIGQLEVEDARIVVDDQPTRTGVELFIERLHGGLPAAADGHLELTGSLDRQALEATLSTGAIADLGEATAAFPVTLTVHLGPNLFALDGTLAEAQDPHAVRLALHAEGPSLDALPPGLGLPFPNTPGYLLTGRLVSGERSWSLEEFEATLGVSHAVGSLAIAAGEVRPRVTGDVHFAKLRVADLGGVVGVGPDDPAPAGPFPRVTFDEDRLYAFDADLRLSAASIEAPLPLTSAKTRLRIDTGRAELDPLALRLAGGAVEGEVAVNGREAVASADADLRFRQLDLRPFFRGTQFVEEMGGSFSGDLYVLGVGRSVDAMLASARGDGHVTMRGGSLSGLMVEGVGVDVVEALAMVVEDARVPVRCGRADFSIDAGVVAVRQALVDTADSLLVMRGTVDLGTETIDLWLEGRAKDFSLIDVAAPVHVTGSFGQPSVRVGEVTGVPLFEIGDQPPVDCVALFRGDLELAR